LRCKTVYAALEGSLRSHTWSRRASAPTPLSRFEREAAPTRTTTASADWRAFEVLNRFAADRALVVACDPAREGLVAKCCSLADLARTLANSSAQVWPRFPSDAIGHTGLG